MKKLKVSCSKHILGRDIPLALVWWPVFAQRASYSARRSPTIIFSQTFYYSRIGPIVSSSAFGWVPSGCPAGVAGLCRGLSFCQRSLECLIFNLIF
jgi:hypothetical protein